MASAARRAASSGSRSFGSSRTKEMSSAPDGSVSVNSPFRSAARMYSSTVVRFTIVSRYRHKTGSAAFSGHTEWQTRSGGEPSIPLIRASKSASAFCPLSPFSLPLYAMASLRPSVCPAWASLSACRPASRGRNVVLSAMWIISLACCFIPLFPVRSSPSVRLPQRRRIPAGLPQHRRIPAGLPQRRRIPAGPQPPADDASRPSCRVSPVRRITPSNRLPARLQPPAGLRRPVHAPLPHPTMRPFRIRHSRETSEVTGFSGQKGGRRTQGR